MTKRHIMTCCFRLIFERLVHNIFWTWINFIFGLVAGRPWNVICGYPELPVHDTTQKWVHLLSFFNYIGFKWSCSQTNGKYYLIVVVRIHLGLMTDSQTPFTLTNTDIDEASANYKWTERKVTLSYVSFFSKLSNKLFLRWWTGKRDFPGKN